MLRRNVQKVHDINLAFGKAFKNKCKYETFFTAEEKCCVGMREQPASTLYDSHPKVYAASPTPLHHIHISLLYP